MGKLRKLLRKMAVRAFLGLQQFLLRPVPPDLKRENRYLKDRLDHQTTILTAFENGARSDAHERILELVEARRMAGTGPWRVSEEVVAQTDKIITATVEALRQPDGRALEYFHANAGVDLKEAGNPLLAQGAFGDIELALQNVEWRREVNLSWLEFSRWGIQQIILICRLHYIKNPTIQRGINVAAQYVFGRGVEVSSPDDDANEVLREFFERNKRVLGQASLTELERQTYYDGNLFFGFFTDKTDTGKVTVRMFDATEIMDVVTDPDDTNTPRFYRREWTSRNFNVMNGQTTTSLQAAWYPALGYDPPAAERVQKIGDKPVIWGVPIYHRKVGAVVNWHFGCPLAYAALDWARASKKFLEACATVKQALAQISMVFTTKGGQAALAAGKNQLSTNVDPQTALWDSNPTPVNASVFGGGPGTTLQAFKTSGAGGDPEEVRRFELMVWRTFGLPETFGGDVKTGNLATAQSLDRPTELNFLEKQERWREDLMVVARFVLQASLGAASGQLRESWGKRYTVDKANGKTVVIVEAPRTSQPGQTVKYKPGQATADKIELMVTFPSIREGDIPELVSAVVEGMTLGNSQGNVVGIDEKAGVRKLYEICDIDRGDELIDQQYPTTGPNKYDPVRKEEAEQPPALPAPKAGDDPPAAVPKPKVEEAFRRLRRSIDRIRERRTKRAA